VCKSGAAASGKDDPKMVRCPEGGGAAKAPLLHGSVASFRYKKKRKPLVQIININSTIKCCNNQEQCRKSDILKNSQTINTEEDENKGVHAEDGDTNK
jgi:hypothetical protein